MGQKGRRKPSPLPLASGSGAGSNTSPLRSNSTGSGRSDGDRPLYGRKILCEEWSRSRTCRYGEQCSCVHTAGVSMGNSLAPGETIARPELCTWFVQSGVCPRVGKSGLGQGERCYQIHPAPGARSRGNALAVNPSYNAEPCAITADMLLLWLRQENPAATELDARLLIVGAVPCPGYVSPAGCQFGNACFTLHPGGQSSGNCLSPNEDDLFTRPAFCAFAPLGKCFQDAACFKIHTTGKSRGNAIARGFEPEPFLKPQLISEEEAAAYKADLGKRLPRARPLNAPAPTRMPKGYVPTPITARNAGPAASSSASAPALSSSLEQLGIWSPSAPKPRTPEEVQPSPRSASTSRPARRPSPRRPSPPVVVSFQPAFTPTLHSPALLVRMLRVPGVRTRLVAVIGQMHVGSVIGTSSATRARRCAQAVLPLASVSSAVRASLFVAVLDTVGLDSLRSFTSFSEIGARYGPQIRRLHVELPTACAYPMARLIKQCPGLVVADLHFVGALASTDKRGAPERLFDAIAELPVLRSLRCRARCAAWTWSFERIARTVEDIDVFNARCLGPARSLRTLVLDSSPAIRPDDALAFLERAPELEVLTVRVDPADADWWDEGARAPLQMVCDERAIIFVVDRAA